MGTRLFLSFPWQIDRFFLLFLCFPSLGSETMVAGVLLGALGRRWSSGVWCTFSTYDTPLNLFLALIIYDSGPSSMKMVPNANMPAEKDPVEIVHHLLSR